MWIKDIRDYILYEDKDIGLSQTGRACSSECAGWQYGYGEPLEELYCSEGAG